MKIRVLDGKLRNFLIDLKRIEVLQPEISQRAVPTSDMAIVLPTNTASLILYLTKAGLRTACGTSVPDEQIRLTGQTHLSPD